MLSCMDQPTMRREYRSSTAATYSQPSAVRVGEVGYPLLVRAIGPELAVNTLSATALRRSLGSPRRRGLARSACSRMSRSMRCRPQADLAQHVVPHTARAVMRSLHLTLVDLRAQHFIAEAALAPGSCEPRVEATPRDTERLAHQIDRPGLGVSPRSRTSHQLLREVGRGFFQDVALHLELGNLLAQSRYLRVLGLLLAGARERLLGLLSQLTNSLAQHVRERPGPWLPGPQPRHAR